MEKIKVQIDGKEVIVDKGTTIIEAARQSGIDIPSLCHDPRIEPFGACRLCFVHIKDNPKPVTACSTAVEEGMVITTESEALADIRKSALELLLSNHYGDCIAPCKLNCPASIDIQGFIAHIANGQHLEAAKLIKETMPFASAVGRVCPRFCEAACRRNIVDKPVAICILKGFAGDQDLAMDNPYTAPVLADTGKKVAVVGGGPAGLTAAYYIRQAGHAVTIFESEEKLGGMLRYGIPEYRLPKKLLDREIDQIIKIGIEVKCNARLGKDYTVDSLKKDGYDAVFLAIGCWQNTDMGLEGQDLPGVYSGIEMLREVAYGREVNLGDKVVIVGGGNTAMDAARTAVRLGAKEVTVVYRRTEKEMPADPREVRDAKEEGVKFKFLANPVKIKGSSRVEVVECIEMELGEPDASGRRRPVPKANSEFDIPVDSVILAIGQGMDKSSLEGSNGVELDRWNCISADESTLVTSAEGVFAAGDCVTGARTVVEAVGQARKAANYVIDYLEGKPVIPKVQDYNCVKGKLDEIDPEEFKHVERLPRVEQRQLPVEDRISNFKEVEQPLTEEEAMKEAKRCLSCGCQDVFDCRLRNLATRHGVEDEKLTKLNYKHAIIDDHDYIIRDPNKCVLCGNCVRICQEVQGVSALGFVQRGLNTVVKPALDVPLSDTPCESCGQCVSACPTGALDVKIALPKPGPFKTNVTEAICAHCGVGCSLEVHTAGQKLISVETSIESQINKGNLCVKGSFEYSPSYDKNRQVAPVVLNSEKTYEDAVKAAVDGLQEVINEHGSESIALVVSAKATNEVGYAAQRFARTALKTNNIDVAGQLSSDLTPYIVNMNVSFDTIEEKDVIVLYKADVAEDYPVVAQRIRKAVAKGAELIIFANESTKLDKLAKVVAKPSEVKFVEIDPAKSVAILDAANVTVDEIDQFSFLQTILLKPANYGGLKAAGVDAAYAANGYSVETAGLNYKQIVEGIEDGKIKGLFVVADEDGVASELLNDDLFTVVITPIQQKELASADVIIPGTAMVETRGSYTNSEGKCQVSANALAPLAGKEVWEIIVDMHNKIVPNAVSTDFKELAKEVG